PPLRSTLFPYTTLFRSVRHGDEEDAGRKDLPAVAAHHAVDHGRIEAGADFQSDAVQGGELRGAIAQRLVRLADSLLDPVQAVERSEEHTSELQSRGHLV